MVKDAWSRLTRITNEKLEKFRLYVFKMRKPVT